MTKTQKEYVVMLIIVAAISIGVPLTLMCTTSKGPDYHCVKYEKDS